MQKLKIRTFYTAAVKNNLKQSPTVYASAVTNAATAQNLKSWKDIPGPPPYLSVIGSLLQSLLKNKMADYRGIKLYDTMYKTYGPIAKVKGNFGSSDMVMLFDPKAIEYVFRSEDMTPIRPGFESLGYYRKHQSKTSDPKKLTGLITEIRSIRDENNMITKKLDVEMNLWALESIGVVALGTRLNCFDPNLTADSPARKLIKNIHDVFQIPEKLEFGTSLWRLFSTPAFKKAMRLYEEQDKLTKYFIDEALKSMKESKKKSGETSCLEKPILEKLLEIDVGIAHVMASDMFMAGVDTVANTALALMYHLAIHPEKQNKLREEVLAKQTRKPYLRACIKESMRMLPVVTGNARLSTKEYNLLGYKIPKGVVILFAHQYMSVMEQHYPKPNEFIPERWLVDKTDPLYHGNTNPFVNIPFGFGVRMCIGRRISELELETFISKVIQNFQVDWKGGPI